jgi:TPR repeat protein
VPPAAEAPKKPEAPAKEKNSKSRRDKKSKKGQKEEEPQQKPAAAEEAPTPKTTPPAPQKTAPPTQAEEAAMAYAKGDYATAESIWRKHAEAGDGQAMNNLGVLYDLGQGVEPDMGRALHWFAESAKTGHPSGMSNYGRMLEQGRGIEANPAEAARWFDLAARQGQPEAQYNLGMLYELGRGVSQDFKAAAAWYSRAAAQQQTEALFRLGHFYRIGQGVTKNPARAVLLLYAAAMNGDTNAMKDLEEMARAEPTRPEAVLFGQRLDNTDRNSMRAALKQYGATVTREDNAYICDLYDAAKVAPGARQMAICYGPGDPAPLGFLELDYAAPDNSIEALILKMVTDRFGPASAGEGDDAHLWNLGSVVVATRYEPTRGQFSLMYMVPRVYHLTRQR